MSTTTLYRPTILFVAMPGAVHTGRWIEQIIDSGWNVHIFSPSPECDLTIHDSIPNEARLHLVVKQRRSRIKQTGIPYPFKKGDRFRLATTKLFEKLTSRAERLAALIMEIKPDIVHSLQMQGPSYLTLRAKEIIESRGKKFPKWIYSSWGSDIYLFSSDKEHAEKIRNVLRATDFLISDCQRDVDLAREYCFKGELLGIYPTGGGFEVEKQQRLTSGPTGSRKIIAVKGIMRSENVGRATVALDALDQCARELEGYHVVVYSAESEALKKALSLKERGRIDLTIFPQSTHDEFVKLLGNTRISIGLNISDGTPNTMLESMMMGAFPIQSDTVSTREWIEHGVNGLLVSPDDPNDLADAIREVINDTEKLERAAKINQALIRERLEREKVRDEVVGIYRSVLEETV